MYNPASSAYRNLPVRNDKPKKEVKGFGLLSRSAPPKAKDNKTKDVKDRIAEYVMEIRKEREKLKNG